MRDKTLIQFIENQNGQNRFTNSSLFAISARVQAMERMLTSWMMLPVILVLSVIYPRGIKQMLKDEIARIEAEAQRG